jgi:hypothetical protein
VQNHGASAFCEVLVRVLEEVHLMSLTSGRPFPAHLVVQADNTVSQCKNQFAFLFLAYLVAKSKFVTTNIFFLMVGHTHEDVDQMFGVVLELILKKHRFETPEGFLELCEKELGHRIKAKGEQLVTQVIECVRNFKLWLDPLHMSVSGAFGNRFGIESPHAFSFKLRRDCTRSDFTNTTRAGVTPGGHPEDVMVCVKAYMRDTRLQDVPDVILPHGRTPAVTTSSPKEIETVHALTTKQIDDYILLMKLCKEDWELERAAEALKKLVAQRSYFRPEAAWLELDGLAHPQPLELGESVFPHLPAASWKLVCRG